MENPDEPLDGSATDEFNQAILAAMMEELGSHRLNDLSLDDKPKASRKINGSVNHAVQPNRPNQVSRLANQNKTEISAWQSFKPKDVDEADLLLDDLGGGQSHRARMQAELATSTSHRGQSSRGGRGGRAGGMSRGGAHVGQSSYRNEKLPAPSLMSHGSRGAKGSSENIANLLRNNGNPGRLVPAVEGQPRGNATSHGMPASARGNASFPRRGSEARVVQTDSRVPRAPKPTQLMSLATPASFFGASIVTAKNKPPVTVIAPVGSTPQTAETAKNKPTVTVIAPVGSTSQTAETVLDPVDDKTLSSSTTETSELETKIPIRSGPQDDLISFDEYVTTEPDMGVSHNMEDMWTLKVDEEIVERIVESTIRGMTEKDARMAALMEQIAKGVVPDGRGIDSSVFASKRPILTRESINEYWESQGKLFRDGLRNAPIRQIFDKAATEIVKGVESSSSKRTQIRKAKLADIANELKPIATPAEDVSASRNISEEAKKPQGSTLKYERSELLKLKHTAPHVINRNALPEEIRSSDYVKSGEVYTTKTGKVVKGLSASRWADPPSTSKVSYTKANIGPAGGTIDSKEPAPPIRRVLGLADSKYADVLDVGNIATKASALLARRVLGLGDSKYAHVPDGGTIAPKAPASSACRVLGLADSKYANVPHGGEASDLISTVKVQFVNTINAPSAYDGNTDIYCQMNGQVQIGTDTGSIQPNNSRHMGEIDDSRWADPPATKELIPVLPTHGRLGTSSLLGHARFSRHSIDGIEVDPTMITSSKRRGSASFSHSDRTRPSMDKMTVSRIINPTLTYEDRKERRKDSLLQLTEATKRRKTLVQGEPIRGAPIDPLAEMGAVHYTIASQLAESLAEVGAVHDTTVPRVASAGTSIVKKDAAGPKLAPAAEPGKFDVKADSSSDPEQQLLVAQTVAIGASQLEKKRAGRCASVSTLQNTRGINSSKYASGNDEISNSTNPGGGLGSSRGLNANSATFKATPSPRRSVSGIFNTNTNKFPNVQSNIVGTPVAFSPQANTRSQMNRYVEFSPPAALVLIQPPVMLWAMVGVPNPARMGSVKTVEGVLMSSPRQDPSAPGTIVAWVTIPNEATPGRMQSIEATLMAPPYDINNNRYHNELFPGWGGGDFAGNFPLLQHPQPIALAVQENYQPGGYQSVAAAIPQPSPQQTLVKIAPLTRVTIRSPLSSKPKNTQYDSSLN